MTQPPPHYGDQPPQYGAGPPYGGYPPPQQAAPTNTMAIIALVCAFLFAPAGLICGIVARRQIKQNGEQGDGLALAAIIISILELVVGVIAFVFVIILIFAAADVVTHFPTPSPFPT
ncbi:MAG: DUF4190 domain-containing protein [Pseudonocardiales bacterium]|nr:MAG: DUF4190 domain-containing protein [Pseudonocardiales bacterium]